MTKNEFISAVSANGGPGCVLNVICDNQMIIRYLDDEHALNLDKDLVTINGVDYIKNHTFVEDSRPEKRCKFKHKITTLHPMEIIQGIQFVDTPDDKQYLDKSQLYEL